jgi:hypothetical protein
MDKYTTTGTYTPNETDSACRRELKPEELESVSGGTFWDRVFGEDGIGAVAAKTALQPGIGAVAAETALNP